METYEGDYPRQFSRGMHSKVVDGVSTTGIEPSPVAANRWESPRFQMNVDGAYEEVSIIMWLTNIAQCVLQH